MQPMLKYRGGKARELPQLLPYIPKDYDVYYEPFLGGGAMFFALEPRKAVLGDLNPRLMEFYGQVQGEYERLRRELDVLEGAYERNRRAYCAAKAGNPQARAEDGNEALYYQMRALYNAPDEAWLSGSVYFFINKTAYSGMIRYNRQGGFNVPYGRYPRFNGRAITTAHRDLLQRAELHCGDYGVLFERAGEGDFMFLDPPYDCVFRDYGNTAPNQGFDEAQHRMLAERFRGLKCRALMVIGRTPLIEELYGDCVVAEYGKRYGVNIRNRFVSESVHWVVRNFS